MRDCENVEILTVATVFKKECNRCMMSLVNDDISDEDIHVSLMADLLEYQNSEAQRVIAQLVLKVRFFIKPHPLYNMQTRFGASAADNF